MAKMEFFFCVLATSTENNDKLQINFSNKFVF